jgi:hypothetical protein
MASNFLEFNSSQALGEHVCRVFRSFDKVYVNLLSLSLLLDVVKADINVLESLIQDRVLCNEDGTLVITK